MTVEVVCHFLIPLFPWYPSHSYRLFTSSHYPNPLSMYCHCAHFLYLLDLYLCLHKAVKTKKQPCIRSLQESSGNIAHYNFLVKHLSNMGTVKLIAVLNPVSMTCF